MSAAARSLDVDAPRMPATARSTRPAFLVGVLVVLGLVPIAGDLWDRPVRSVRVAGEFHRVSKAALESAVAGHAGEGFLRSDVDAVREAAAALPWVREASVRRVWPDSLHIAVIERQAVARWGDGALLESDGSLFRPDDPAALGELPSLAGPEGRHAVVLERYGQFRAALAAGPWTELGSVVLEDRGNWRLGLADGPELVLGHLRPVETLRRNAGAFRAAASHGGRRPARIDLRYANGFAVRWHEEARTSHRVATEAK